MRRRESAVQAVLTVIVIISVLLGLGPIVQATALVVPANDTRSVHTNAASDVTIQCHWISQQIDCTQVSINVNLEKGRWYKFVVSGTFPDGQTDTITSEPYYNGSGSGYQDLSVSFDHGHNPGTYGPHSASVQVEIRSSSTKTGSYSRFGSVSPNPRTVSASNLKCGYECPTLDLDIKCDDKWVSGTLGDFGADSIVIRWGDGSSTSYTSPGAVTHLYNHFGDYTVSVYARVNGQEMLCETYPITLYECPQLQVSHIDCVAPGQVEVHFILNSAPGDVDDSGTELHFSIETPCGTEDLVAPYWKKTGAAIHYLYADYACGDGEYTVTSASVDLGVFGVISAHNTPFGATVSGCECLGSISGYKKDTEGVALAGFTVELYRWDDSAGAYVNTGLSETTTESGYTFDNIIVGTYKVVVVEDNPDYSGVVTEQEVTLTCDSPNQIAPDLVNAACSGNIWGYKCIGGESPSVVGGCATGHEGVTIQLTGSETSGGAVNQTTTTNASGYYEFSDLLPGVYNLTVLDVPGYRPEPAEYTDISLQCSDTVGPYQFINQPCVGSIGGVKTKTIGGETSAHGGVTIRLTGIDVHSQSHDLTTVTDAGTGAYLFDGLPPGDYTISVDDMPGWTTDPTSYDVELGCDEDVTGKDFANTYTPCDPANVVLQDPDPAWSAWVYYGDGQERRERTLIYVDKLTGEFCHDEPQEEFRPYTECETENLRAEEGAWSEWAYNPDSGLLERTRTVSYYDVNSGVFCHDEEEKETQPYTECETENLRAEEGPWSEWAYNPDSGLLERTRTISYYDVNSGVFCHDEEEKETQPYTECETENLRAEEGEWSEWAYNPDSGLLERTRTISYYDVNSGVFCHDEEEKETQPYTDCETENLRAEEGVWSEWAYNPDSGLLERTRTISYYDVNTGVFCHDEEEKETQPYTDCETENLRAEEGVWSEWAYNPDTGMDERTRTISYYDVNSGVFCHDEEEKEERSYGECAPENLRTEEGEWSEWVYNPDTGNMERTRTISYYDINTGTLCDMEEEKQEEPYEECLIENLRTEEGEWSEWVYNPDTGNMERTRTISYYDINTGTLCDMEEEKQEEPYEECLIENLRTEEGEWSEWVYNPDTGNMERTRTISYYDINTGTLCDMEEEKQEEPYEECLIENLRTEEGEWSEWVYNPDTGNMERTRTISYYDVNTGTLCDMEEEKQEEPYNAECPNLSLDELGCNDLLVTGTLSEFIADSITIEWGDGESDTYDGPGGVAHTYPDFGEYIIDIYVNIGEYQELCDPVVVDIQPFCDGSLIIEKVWDGEPSTQSIEFTVTGPDGYEETVMLTGNDSQTLTGLSVGEYTVDEAVPSDADWDPQSDTSQQASLSCEQTEDSVTFVNKLVDSPPPVEYEVSVDQDVDCYGFVVFGQAHDGAILKVTVVEEGDDPETYSTQVSGAFSEPFARKDPAKDGPIDLTAELWTLDEQNQLTVDELNVTLSDCEPVVPPIRPPTTTTERDVPSHHQILIYGQYAGDPHDAHDAVYGAGGAGTVTEREVRKANSGIIPGSNLVHPLSGEEQTVEVVLLTFNETSPDVTKYRSPVLTGVYPVSYYHFQDIAKGRIIGDLPRTGIFLVRIGRSVAVFAASEPGVDKDVDGKSDPRMIDFSFVRYQNGILKAFIDVPGSNAYKDPNMQKAANAYAWAIQRELVRLGYSIVDNELAGTYLVTHGIESLWEDPKTGQIPDLNSVLSLIKGQPLLVGEEFGGVPPFMGRAEDGTLTDLRLNADAFRSTLPSGKWGAGSLVPLQIDAEKPADFGQYVVDRYFIFTKQ